MPLNKKLKITASCGIPLNAIVIRRLKKERYKMNQEQANQEYHDNVLSAAIEVYGVDDQFEKIEEECIELALAMHRYRNSKQKVEFIDKLIDEIADVKNVIRIAEMIFNKIKIDERVDFKIKRLSEKLPKEQFDPKWVDKL